MRGIRKIKHSMFSESEEGETLALIKKLDPAWDLHEMLVMLEDKVLSKWVESFLRGDEEGIEFISHWCTDRALQMCIVHFKERERVRFCHFSVAFCHILSPSVTVDSPSAPFVAVWSFLIHCRSCFSDRARRTNGRPRALHRGGDVRVSGDR